MSRPRPRISYISDLANVFIAIGCEHKIYDGIRQMLNAKKKNSEPRNAKKCIVLVVIYTKHNIT